MSVTVSVVMPSRNAEPWVREAIRSVLAQSFTDFELIVVDDGSEDATVEIVRALKDSRIRILEGARVGFVKALNRGFRDARGEWIARMDADDVCHPDRLAAQIGFLRQTACLLVSCRRSILTPGGKFLVPRRRYETCWLTPADITLRRIQFTEGATVFNRRASSDVSFFDEEFDCETSLYYKLLARGNGAVLGEVLYAYRIQPNSHSKTDLREQTLKKIAVRQKYDSANVARLDDSGKKKITGRAQTELFSRLVRACVAAGDFESARSIAATTAKRWPLDPRSWQTVASALTGRRIPRVWQREVVAGWGPSVSPWENQRVSV
jgi:glycosyltransferase involved in cell wall biosynthesis